MTVTETDLKKHQKAWAENHALVQTITGQRAQFAAMAMQGLCANPEFFGSCYQGSAAGAASFAVQAADALMQELSK